VGVRARWPPRRWRPSCSRCARATDRRALSPPSRRPPAARSPPARAPAAAARRPDARGRGPPRPQAARLRRRLLERLRRQGARRGAPPRRARRRANEPALTRPAATSQVEPGEGVAAAAARELAEECGLAAPPAALARRGQLTFLWEDQPAEPPWEVSVFAVEASACGGGVRASDEMAPRWFPADLAALPFEEMWADDVHWWPLLLKEGAPLFEGRFRFADGTRLVEVEALREVAALPPLAR
jgi:ADP-ribose pyrophosphatase YjhB (NUDIX family)